MPGYILYASGVYNTISCVLCHKNGVWNCYKIVLYVGRGQKVILALFQAARRGSLQAASRQWLVQVLPGRGARPGAGP